MLDAAERGCGRSTTPVSRNEKWLFGQESGHFGESTEDKRCLMVKRWKYSKYTVSENMFLIAVLVHIA